MSGPQKSPGEPITISAEERGGFAVISVADKGPGIAPAEIGHIFDKFYRGKSQRYRVHGTGMGLPISKAIVEAHGGVINLKSTLGQGSVFTFSLPLEPCAESPEPSFSFPAAFPASDAARSETRV